MISMGPEIVYIGEKPFDPITLDIRLSSEAECTVYDDDEVAHTEEIVKCLARKNGGEITLHAGPSGKTFVAKFNKTGRPKQVTVNGKEVPHFGSQQALEKAALGWYFDPSSVVYVKFGASGSGSELLLRT
jgi:hypothetical protein